MLHGKLRSVFDARAKESTKAVTLQEAVQMLTDEYVGVMDQLRTCQAALAAEQQHTAALEREREALQAEGKALGDAARCEKARTAACRAELFEMDMLLVPRLSGRGALGLRPPGIRVSA